MIDLAKPNDAEMRALARREASPGDAASFSPICLGPLGNAALLLGIGALALFWVPARLLARVTALRGPRSEDAG